ncbi:unnamed protein product [Owenia fusiformis]|uniref:AAA+ ATPase domain-containing protein n=1 Tax=Owenia fusiformis TaxID=6347 RepID=A0A8J1U4I8_OWEFU|nr:unnamed protein product [Owenia fusiformis]
MSKLRLGSSKSGKVHEKPGNRADPWSGVLSGQSSGDLPPLPINNVRIYLAATGFSEEKQKIWEDTLPEVQDHFLQQGVNIILIDPNCDPTNDHTVDAIALERHVAELRVPETVNTTATVVLGLVGNKYGQVPLPTNLEEDELAQIKRVTLDAGKDVALLEEWYTRDDNSQSSVFRLRPIESKFNLYTSRGAPETDSAATLNNTWIGIYTMLSETIQSAVAILCKETKKDKHASKVWAQDKFYKSALDVEICTAIQNHDEQTLLIRRKCEDIDRSDESASDYIDIPDPSVKKPASDNTVKTKMDAFMQTVNAHATQSHIEIFKLHWGNNGFNPEEFNVYLEEFNALVATKLKTLIQHMLDHRKEEINRGPHTLDHNEALLHLTHRQAIIDKSFSSDRTIQDIKELILADDTSTHKPIILCGPPGSGKSTIAATIPHTEIFGKETFQVIRFISLDQNLSSTHGLLYSVCSQLNAMFNKNPNNSLSNDIDTLVEQFREILVSISNSHRHLLLIIDGIESVKPPSIDSKLEFDWKMENLPPRTHIIETFNITKHTKNDLENIKSSSESVPNILHTTPITSMQCLAKTKALLSNVNRTITRDQENALKTSFSEGSMPILPVIVFDVAKTLHSSTATIDIGRGMDDVLNKRFEALEKRYTVEIIAPLCRYIACSNMGVTELEIIDIMSCTNESILAFHGPKLPVVLRFPYSTWSDIRHDLGIMLEQRETAGSTLFSWRNQTIKSVVKVRYLQTVETLKQNHKALAELFLETWIDGRPLVDPDLDLQIMQGRRCISQQPLLYSDTLYNLRKLNELWYQLLHSGMVDALKENCFCNFEYLLAKSHSSSIDNLIKDLNTSLLQVMDIDIILITACIKAGRGALSTDPLQLANELIGHLKDCQENYPRYIEPIVTQCMQWCDTYTLPLVVPFNSWLQTPDVDLVNKIHNPGSTHAVATFNTHHIFCNVNATNNIVMYHGPSKTLVKTFAGHRDKITCILMSHNNQVIVSGSDDASVRVWDIASGKNIFTFREHSHPVKCIALNHKDEFLISGCLEGTFKMLSLQTGELLHSVQNGPVSCIFVNASDSILYAATEKKIKLWCMTEMVLLETIQDDNITSDITCMVMSQDGSFILIACGDTSLQLRSAATGTFLHYLEGHNAKICDIGISRESFQTVVGCEDGTLHVYNLRSKELLQTFNTGTQPVTTAQISRDDSFIIACNNEYIFTWILMKGLTKEAETNSHVKKVTCLAVSKDGKMIVSGSEDRTVKLWNLDSTELDETLEGHEDAITCVTFADDQSFVASGSTDLTVKVWSIVMACVITNYTEHETPITAVDAISKGYDMDYTRIVSADAGNIVRIWKAEDGETILKLDGPTTMFCVSPEANFAVSGDGDQFLKLWTLPGGDLVQKLNHASIITCTAFSKDALFLVTGSQDKSLKVWEASTGKLTQVLVEHDDHVSCVSVTDSNSHVLSGSLDTTIMIWGLSTGAVEHKLRGHTAEVTVVQVTSDGSIAISGSKDGTLRVWSINRGSILTMFDVHYPILNIVMKFDAGHIAVHLEENNNIPLLCLHNSPASEVKSHSDIDIHIIPGDNGVLPIKPRNCVRSTSVYPVPKRKDDHHRFSVSTIPEIIKMSPIKGNQLKPKGTKSKGNKSKKGRKDIKADDRSIASGSSDGGSKDPCVKASRTCVLL